MSLEFIFRLVGMVIFAIMGAYAGFYLARVLNEPVDMYSLLIGLVGALAGLVLTPFLTTRPARSLRVHLARLSAQTLVAGLIGLIAGLIIAALLAFPLSMLPEPFRSILPFIGVLVPAEKGCADASNADETHSARPDADALRQCVE